MKRCSFKVAKALKEAGYPQDNSDYLYDKDGCFASRLDYESWGIRTWDKIAMPTYIDVWLWLWKEKDIRIEVKNRQCSLGGSLIYHKGKYIAEIFCDEPEKIISVAIEYIVDNNLLK